MNTSRTIEERPDRAGASNLPDSAKVQKLLRALRDCSIELPADADPGDPGRFTDLLLVACLNSPKREVDPYQDAQTADEATVPIAMSLWPRQELSKDEVNAVLDAFEEMLPGGRRPGA